MFKWVVGLCATMYIVLMTAGEPSPNEVAAREVNASQHVTRNETTQLETPVVVIAAPAEAAESMPIPAVATISDIIESPVLVSATTEATTPVVSEPIATEVISAIAPEAAADIRRVTGKRVNLRAGPSTTTEIIGRAVRNDSAEVMELLPSGWAKVYILETGLEAYISSQFLSSAG
ncbi:SH3 domain-containing protein [Litoreibacter janthinus]|uniref:SH3 domain-containing protein n=1 Tax=Litoreibacter janthinus TaxID=670154 RepID=A0A1I6FPD2_9RHOB|nr:SH3 domain-containing protein [Litoreibacter janthinus]SFR31801.1 SH3 domain-containing protein [Litoreibacter janthinus]